MHHFLNQQFYHIRVFDPSEVTRFFRNFLMVVGDIRKLIKLPKIFKYGGNQLK